MAGNRKPRRPHVPRLPPYPDLIDVGRIFRPIHRMFEQLRSGEVDSSRGKPIFKDWQGHLCEIVPALDGWCDCWQRIATGEGLALQFVATRRLVHCLDFGIMMTRTEVDAAFTEVAACQRACLKVRRAAMGAYLRTEQVAIEVDRLGLRHAG